MDRIASRLLVCALLISSGRTLFAQSGPGGVGSTDGTSSLVLWLRPNIGLFQDPNGTTAALQSGDSVALWTDQSGWGNDAAQSSNPNKRPVRDVGTSCTGLDFSVGSGTGNESEIYTASLGSNKLSGPFTVFVVGRKKSPQSSTIVPLIESRTRGNTGEFLGFAADTTHVRLDGGSTISGPTSGAITQQVYHIYRGVFNGSNSSIAVDGVIVASGNGGTKQVDGWRIGCGGSPERFLDGYISEVIVYNDTLSRAEIALVQNYLASGASNSCVTSTPSFYSCPDSLGITGIIDIGGSTVTTSGPSGGLRVKDNGFLNDDSDAVFIGYDDTTSVDQSTSDLPSGVLTRWTRVWCVDKNEAGTNGGSVKFIFNFRDARIHTHPANAGGYRLLYRSGTSGTFSTVTVTSDTIVGDSVIFTLPGTTLTDGHYTLGSASYDSPLPVELSSMSARSTSSGVQVEWGTASELNNAGFILSRADGPEGNLTPIASWRSDPSLVGLGTSSIGKRYSYLDPEKLIFNRVYRYRVQSVNLDGTISDDSRTVSILALPVGSLGYDLAPAVPNPLGSSTRISYTIPEPGIVSIDLYDALGRIVRHEAIPSDAGTSSLVLDASKLASGVYHYVMTSGTFRAARSLQVVR